jgi:hypothetical protein
MKAQDLTLSFRDVARYIVPGSAAVALILWFMIAFAGVHIDSWNPGLGDSILFLLAAYVAGHILDMLSNRFPILQYNRITEKIVEDIRSGKDAWFSPEFRERLDNKIREHLHVPLSSVEAFSLCDTFITGHQTAREQERYTALTGLYGGLYMSCWLSVVLSTLVSLKHVVLLILPLFNVIIPVTSFLDFAETQLIGGLVVLCGSVFLLRPLHAETVGLNESYVLETYRAFYVLCAQRESEKTHDRS